MPEWLIGMTRVSPPTSCSKSYDFGGTAVNPVAVAFQRFCFWAIPFVLKVAFAVLESGISPSAQFAEVRLRQLIAILAAIYTPFANVRRLLGS